MAPIPVERRQQHLLAFSFLLAAMFLPKDLRRTRRWNHQGQLVSILVVLWRPGSLGWPAMAPSPVGAQARDPQRRREPLLIFCCPDNDRWDSDRPPLWVSDNMQSFEAPPLESSPSIAGPRCAAIPEPDAVTKSNLLPMELCPFCCAPRVGCTHVTLRWWRHPSAWAGAACSTVPSPRERHCVADQSRALGMV
jgi:hypothetical protein